MTSHDIIDVQLESFFGEKFPQKIQALVDDELNQGRWAEGYDMAVAKGVIDGDSARQLLEIVLTQSPDLRIDRAVLDQEIDRELPQSMCASVDWLVDGEGAFALTDSLRVARFERTTLIWCTPRISWDGILLDSIEGGLLHGRTWHLSSSVSPDCPFTINFESGELVEGQVVQ